MTWEKLMDVCERWSAAVARIPPRSRKGKVVRNVVIFLLAVVVYWAVAGAPALTAMWQFRRLERQHFVGPSEVIADLDVDWANWTYQRLLVAETEESYILYMPESGMFRNFEIWEKQGEVMLVPGPDCNAPTEPAQAAPFVLLTQLPAARAEVEFTLPEGYFTGSKDDPRPNGTAYRAEGACQSGVFVFALPEALPREEDLNDPFSNVELAAEQYHDLYALRSWSIDLRYEEQIILPVPVTVRLWDGQGTLIYDETLIYGAERGDAGEP